MKNLKFSVFMCLFFVQSVLSAHCQESQLNPNHKSILYPNLEKGNFDVGFRTFIDYDYSRTYNLNYPDLPTSGKADPRPVIINLWYPAKASKQDKPILYGDYINLQSDDPALKKFTKRIQEYNIENSCLYMFNDDSLNDDQKEKLSVHLKQPIHVFKNASPLSEKFPLVIYHAGLGGTLNDNTILCEYLASHGFVVLSGSFHSGNYEYVDLDWDLERSTKDIDFMLNSIKNTPFIDFSKIAAIGQSYGAQAVLGYKSEDYSPVSCLISLDNTFDYSIDSNPREFQPLIEKIYKKWGNMNTPTLVFAGPAASFKVMDSLKNSDRTYAIIKLEHNDYTSLSSYAILKGLQKKSGKESIWEKYVMVNKYCLNFIRWKLFNDTSARKFIFHEHPFLLNVYDVPKGMAMSKDFPEYTDYSTPPTHFQLMKLIQDKDKHTIEIIVKKYPDSLDEDLINNSGYIMLKKDVTFAIYLFQTNILLYPDSWNAYDSLGEAYSIIGDNEAAVKYYKKSVELNPKNVQGLKMIEKLK